MMTWKPGFYNDGNDFHAWDEPEDAHDAAHDEICGYRDDSYWGEWSDQVDKVGYGICLPLAVATEEYVDVEDAPEGAVDYHLREPEIDAAAFWAVVTEHAPKLAEALAMAAPLVKRGTS